jgi:hypothetical protein
MTLPFGLQAIAGCPTHADLLHALAAEFGTAEAEPVEAAFGSLAADVIGECASTPGEQMQALSRMLRGFQPARTDSDHRPLMLDAVLSARAGHPLLLAVVALEVGRRAGFDVGVVGDGKRHLVVHRDADPAVGLDPARRDATAPQTERLEGFAWRCSHQMAFTVLTQLVECSVRTGAWARAIHAAELRLALPVSDPVLAWLQRELLQLKARLN